MKVGWRAGDHRWSQEKKECFLSFAERLQLKRSKVPDWWTTKDRKGATINGATINVARWLQSPLLCFCFLNSQKEETCVLNKLKLRWGGVSIRQPSCKLGDEVMKAKYSVRVRSEVKGLWEKGREGERCEMPRRDENEEKWWRQNK